MQKNRFWQRSSFGAFLFFLGSLLIYWMVEDQAPTAEQWVQALVLLLTVFGYQVARPSARIPK